jgi:hypothetical protein
MVTSRLVLMYRPVQAGAWLGMCREHRVETLKALGWRVLLSEADMLAQDIADTYRADQRGFLGLR